MKTPIELIIEERKRQQEKEGWTIEHDDKHTDQSLPMAAALYAAPVDTLVIENIDFNINERNTYSDPWPWWDHFNYDRYNDGGINTRHHAWDKRKKHNRMKRLQIAGALIVAEMERLQRSTNS